ncbi:hypothetical protein LZ31DRAFT_549619 [Colletotrichum somersetense]|nr:hypothetical protein LZ31DRAFT_549619 [Colletotrichum somersetense]
MRLELPTSFVSSSRLYHVRRGYEKPIQGGPFGLWHRTPAAAGCPLGSMSTAQPVIQRAVLVIDG